jgi:hypothetical protein
MIKAYVHVYAELDRFQAAEPKKTDCLRQIAQSHSFRAVGGQIVVPGDVEMA